MIKNLDGFKNNEENGNDNRKEGRFGMVLRVEINTKEQKNEPDDNENYIDKHEFVNYLIII